jgi:hypothetical protein
MDYGLEHVLGNLLTVDHAALHTGEPFRRVVAGLSDEDSGVICRRCELSESAASEETEHSREAAEELKGAPAVSPAASGPRIVALLAVRNERLFLRRCIEHLVGQGVEVYVIDNGSTDESRSIAESVLGRGVVGVESHPFSGWYELDRLLERKEQLARELDADWFMHQDADEIRLAPAPFGTLREAVAHVEGKGYNAVNFDEFVFVPTRSDETFEGKDYESLMSSYYFFAPHPLRQVKLWRKTLGISLSPSGGHRANFEGRAVYPVNFVLKHYIGLSREHIAWKYSRRRFSPRLVAKGWHGRRPELDPATVRLPPREALKTYRHDNVWDRTDPWRRHFFDP